MQAQSKTEFDLAEYVPLIVEVIESGGEFRLFPRGTSMLPLLRQGKDSVILVKCPEQPKKRDIIFYKRPNGQFVLHRILKRATDGTYILCGDNQTKPECDVRESMMIARAVSMTVNGHTFSCDSEKYRKWVKKWLKMPYRRLALITYRAKEKLKARGKK